MPHYTITLSGRETLMLAMLFIGIGVLLGIYG